MDTSACRVPLGFLWFFFFFTAHSVLVAGDISGDPWATEVEGDSPVSTHVDKLYTAKAESGRTSPQSWTTVGQRGPKPICPISCLIPSKFSEIIRYIKDDSIKMGKYWGICGSISHSQHLSWKLDALALGSLQLVCVNQLITDFLQLYCPYKTPS